MQHRADIIGCDVASFGNKKLPKTTMIINFTSATHCPSKLAGLCKVSNICYAMKAERLYPSVLPYRERQAQFFSDNSVEYIASEYISIIKRKENTKYPVDCIRFSEAGDFTDQGALDKFTEICLLVKQAYPSIRIYGYSARYDLDFTELKKIAVIQGSGFMISNNFYVVKEINTEKPYCSGDCKACNMCQFATGLNIQVKQH